MKAQPIQTEYKGYKFRSRLEARWAVFFDAVGCQYEYEPEGYELQDGTKYLPDFYIPKHDLFVEIKPAMPKTPTREWHEYHDKAEHKMILLCEETTKNGMMINGSPGEKLNFRLWPSKGFNGLDSNQWCLVYDGFDAVQHPLIHNEIQVDKVAEWYFPSRSDLPSIKFGGEIVCPVCGFDYVHPISVNEIMWGKDARFGAEIKMECEDGHEFSLCFGNWKGIGQWWVTDLRKPYHKPFLALAGFDELLLELAMQRAKQARFEFGQTPSSEPIQIS